MELFANDLFGQNVRISDRRNRTIEPSPLLPCKSSIPGVY
jgi:hypothetical protein